MVSKMVSTPLLNSSDAFRYILLFWKIGGLLTPSSNNIYLNFLYIIYAIIIHLTLTIATPILMLTNLWFLSDISLILKNLMEGLLVLVSSLKQAAIFWSISNLLNSNTFLEKLDRRVVLNVNDAQQCHKIFYTIFVTFQLTGFVYVVQGFLNKRLPFEIWMPFDWRATSLNYLSGLLYQMLALIILSFHSTECNAFSLSYINIIIGHIHCLNMRISRIGLEGSALVLENNDELVKCIEDHKNIMGYVKLKILSIYFF